MEIHKTTNLENFRIAKPEIINLVKKSLGSEYVTIKKVNISFPPIQTKQLRNTFEDVARRQYKQTAAASSNNVTIQELVQQFPDEVANLVEKCRIDPRAPKNTVSRFVNCHLVIEDEQNKIYLARKLSRLTISAESQENVQYGPFEVDMVAKFDVFGDSVNGWGELTCMEKATRINATMPQITMIGPAILHEGECTSEQPPSIDEFEKALGGIYREVRTKSMIIFGHGSFRDTIFQYERLETLTPSEPVFFVLPKRAKN